MKTIKFIVFSLSCLLVAQTQASFGNVIEKRINTTQCRDADDWYLDGYRVGKSFRQQKESMLSQRMSFCHFTAKSLPKQFKKNWDSGYRFAAK